MKAIDLLYSENCNVYVYYDRDRQFGSKKNFAINDIIQITKHLYRNLINTKRSKRYYIF